MTGSANGVIYVSIRCVVICCIPPFRPELLLELVKLVEFTDRETPPSSLEIASCLLMGFDYPGSVRGLASHLREAGHSAEAVLVLAGKREVTDEF